MLDRTISLPELGLIAATRAILGAGVGLLLADHMSAEHRRTAGWILASIGALATIPLAADVIYRRGTDSAPPINPAAPARRDFEPAAGL